MEQQQFFCLDWKNGKGTAPRIGEFHFEGTTIIGHDYSSDLATVQCERCASDEMPRWNIFRWSYEIVHFNFGVHIG